MLTCAPCLGTSWRVTFSPLTFSLEIFVFPCASPSDDLGRPFFDCSTKGGSLLTNSLRYRPCDVSIDVSTVRPRQFSASPVNNGPWNFFPLTAAADLVDCLSLFPPWRTCTFVWFAFIYFKSNLQGNKFNLRGRLVIKLRIVMFISHEVNTIVYHLIPLKTLFELSFKSNLIGRSGWSQFFKNEQGNQKLETNWIEGQVKFKLLRDFAIKLNQTIHQSIVLKHIYSLPFDLNSFGTIVWPLTAGKAAIHVVRFCNFAAKFIFESALNHN